MISIYICIRLYVFSLHNSKGNFFAVLEGCVNLYLCLCMHMHVFMHTCFIKNEVSQTSDVSPVNVNMNINDLLPCCQHIHANKWLGHSMDMKYLVPFQARCGLLD